MILRHRFATLIVTISTFVATVLLFIVIPKGFFPVQDTGVILGISEAPQTVSFTSMAQRQQKLVDVVLQDPAVDNVSSFIGVDGTNTTLNSGRIQITLKPLDVRKVSATEVIQRMQSKVNAVEGIQLFLQPLQDLTVEDRVSRTEFQYALEDPDQNELATYTRKMVTELSKENVVTDVASDLQDQGLSAAACDRSRHRGPAWHCHGRRGQHAVRRVWPAPGVDHLYPAEPVPRGDGSGGELPDRSGDAEHSLRQVGATARRFR